MDIKDQRVFVAGPDGEEALRVAIELSARGAVAIAEPDLYLDEESIEDGGASMIEAAELIVLLPGWTSSYEARYAVMLATIKEIPMVEGVPTVEEALVA